MNRHSFTSWLLVCFVSFVLSSLAHADPICVTSRKAKLRKGPGNEYPVTWTVGQYMPLMKVDQRGGWYQVKDLDGSLHWIQSNMVSSKISCAVVKTKTASLRSGPGQKFPKAEPQFAERYTPFRKLDRDGSWILVQDDYQGKYWVNENHIWMPLARAVLVF